MAVGKTSITNASVSLEFADGPKGIILPYVENKINITTPGTLYLDAQDARIKLKTASGEFDYSGGIGDISHNGTVDISLQTGLTENVTAKTIIGANSSTADGVLILEDSKKAMILPRIVAPELNITNPSPGTLIYDPFKKVLCFYNGKEWSYWEGVAN